MEKFKTALKNEEDEEYLDFTLDSVSNIKTDDKLHILEDCYLFVLKTHLYHRYIFDPMYTHMSEADYVVKVWSPLFEIMFRSLGQHFSSLVITHWDETINPQVKKDHMNLRMDLRFVSSSLADSNKTVDMSTGEFAPCVYKSKHYKDKLKTALASKSQMNDIFQKFPGLTEEIITSTAIPFILVMG